MEGGIASRSFLGWLGGWSHALGNGAWVCYSLGECKNQPIYTGQVWSAGSLGMWWKGDGTVMRQEWMWWQGAGRLMVALGMAAMLLVSGAGQSGTVAAASAITWPSYLGNISHTNYTNYNGAEQYITPGTVGRLYHIWTARAGGGISGQPIVVNNAIYWGSWDGYLHATSPSGRALWQTFLGYTYVKRCYPPEAGVASTPSFAVINGQPILIVGGGNATLYALNANTGRILWHTLIGTVNQNFLWSSPEIVNGNVYIGLASFGDCPLVQGGLAELNAATGSIENIFYTVPDGCTGGSIWGAPTYDMGRNLLYVATGNSGTCDQDEPNSDAILALNANDLSLADSWQVPTSEQVFDSDFGATPTLFTSSDGTDLVGVPSNDGWFYAMNRDFLGFGPVWQQRLSDVGGDCTFCGEGSISSATWIGNDIVLGGGDATINGQSCKGNLSALDPATGNYNWRVCLAQPILGAVSAIPNIIIAATGTQVLLRSSSNGRSLATFTDASKGSTFYSSASIINGRIYIGNMDGNLLVYGLW